MCCEIFTTATYYELAGMSFVQRQRHSFGDISLVEAVIQGDEERVRAAIDAGADVNALDHDGRSVISCAITGEK